MEFFNYLKISELTNLFLLKPPDHSSFSRYMSNILAYCLQLRKQVDLEDFCLFQMFECFFIFIFKDKLVNRFYFIDATLKSWVAKNAIS